MQEDENFFSSSLNWVEDKVSKHFKNICSKRPLLGWGLLVLSWLGYWGFQQIKSVPVVALVPDPPNLPASLPNAGNLNATTSQTGGPENFVFTNYWRPEQEHAYGINGQTILLLPQMERVRFDYVGPVPVEQVFKLTLALGGQTGGNFQYGRDGAWELTIGDGDFQTITLKDGTGVEIAEEVTKDTRPRLDKKLLRDVGFEILISEEKIVDELLITLLITKNEFKFKIPLPEKWEEKDDVYFGLLDYTLGENLTNVYWEEPNLVEFINN